MINDALVSPADSCDGSLQQEPDMGVSEPLITMSPERLSGTPVFAGTQVPVQTLIDYLEAGEALGHSESPVGAVVNG